MDQTNHFFNLGYGWLWKHCSAEDAERRQQIQTPPRSTSHSDGNVNSGLPLASWIDSSRQGLTCRRCGIEETLTGGGSLLN